MFALEKFDTGMHFIRVPNKIAKELLVDNNKRVIVTVNNSLALHCAILHSKAGFYFINIGLTNCKKLKLKTGDSLSATFKVDTTEHQFKTTEALDEVLKTDLAAKKIFDNLTQGNQRSLIYLVEQPKSVDKKVERALKIAAQLKLGITNARVILKN